MDMKKLITMNQSVIGSILVELSRSINPGGWCCDGDFPYTDSVVFVVVHNHST